LAARPRQVSDDDILKAASECFLEHGFGVSTRVIADRLNISQPALFKRFSTKEELMLRALLPPEQPPLVGWLDAGPSEEPFKPQFEALFTQLWKTVCFVLPRVAVLMSSGIAHDTIVKRYKKFPLLNVIHALSGWLGRAQALGHIRQLGDPASLAQACLGPLQGRALVRFLLVDPATFEERDSAGGSASDDAYIAMTIDLLWRALAAEAD
jgi:AcrR family transcriptional regulator